MAAKMASSVRGLCSSLRQLRFLEYNFATESMSGWGIIKNKLVGSTPHRGHTVQSLFSAIGKMSQVRLVGGSGLLESQLEISYDYNPVEEYYKHRRIINGGLTHKALLVDAAGTLLVPSQPCAEVYRKIGVKYGVTLTEQEILERYRWAYSQPWGHSSLRYVDDGRPFWQYIVEQATGCSDQQYFEELYHYYSTAQAWHLDDLEAGKVLKTLREAGVKLAVVSNFDTRLRPLLLAVDCDHWFDAVAVSAEVEAEKPNPTIFLHACEALGVSPDEAVHVGDDRRNDVWGARDAGCDAWLWGGDVHSFREVAERIGVYVS